MQIPFFRTMSTSTSAATQSTSGLVADFLRFLHNSPSPFHAVNQCRERLVKHGFEELRERERWSIAEGGRYYFTRNQSTIVAFVAGGRFVSLR
jgi:aspartyl aminopeptidase